MMTSVLFCAEDAEARTKVRGGLRVLRMEPQGDDAEDFSDANWGGGLYADIQPSGNKFLSFSTGVDIVHMMSQTIEFRDRLTGLRIEQQTRQFFTRFYAGLRLGPQGRGTLRPYVESNLALHYYSITTDVVIPDDRSYEDEIRQNLDREGETAFGFDAGGGLEIRVAPRVFLDFGAKYVKSFEVPQQLGPDSEKISPDYIQMFIGVAYQFN